MVHMTQERRTAWAQKVRVLIIAGTDSVGDWMAGVVKSTPGMESLGLVRDPEQPFDYLEQLAPDVIVVDISSGILHMGDLINRLSPSGSGAAVIVVAMKDEVDAVRQAMLHGAQGFLLKPFSEAELLSSIGQAYELVVQRRAQLAAVPQLMPGPEVKAPPRAKVVGVYSPKGGVGCTTIAVNLAVALRAVTHKSVILMDADLRFGDIDSVLNILTGPSLGTLVNKLDDADSAFLEQSLVTHKSGVKVLMAPPYLDMADAIQPGQIKQIITRLAALGEGYVIVDTWSALDDVTLAVVDACDKLVVIATPQVTALRDTHRFLEALNLLHYDPDKIMLVLNHPYQPGTVKRSDVERALDRSIIQEITHTPHQVSASLNRGVPLVQEFHDSPAARDITKLARSLVGMDTAEKQAEVGSKPAPASERNTGKRKLFAWGATQAVSR
jgi:pilus assembly protein CpaE